MKTKGFGLPAAIFLLTVLAALAAFIGIMSATSHVISSEGWESTRAYWAVRAGVEWALARAKADSAHHCLGLSSVPDCPTDGTVSAPVNSTLTIEGFSVNVECTCARYHEGSNPVTLHWVTATATAGGSPGSIGFVERSVQGTAEF